MKWYYITDINKKGNKIKKNYQLSFNNAFNIAFNQKNIQIKWYR
jgi:hypothetical protein